MKLFTLILALLSLEASPQALANPACPFVSTALGGAQRIISQIDNTLNQPGYNTLAAVQQYFCIGGGRSGSPYGELRAALSASDTYLRSGNPVAVSTLLNETTLRQFTLLRVRVGESFGLCLPTSPTTVMHILEQPFTITYTQHDVTSFRYVINEILQLSTAVLSQVRHACQIPTSRRNRHR